MTLIKIQLIALMVANRLIQRETDLILSKEKKAKLRVTIFSVIKRVACGSESRARAHIYIFCRSLHVAVCNKSSAAEHVSLARARDGAAVAVEFRVFRARGQGADSTVCDAYALSPPAGNRWRAAPDSSIHLAASSYFFGLAEPLFCINAGPKAGPGESRYAAFSFEASQATRHGEHIIAVSSGYLEFLLRRIRPELRKLAPLSRRVKVSWDRTNTVTGGLAQAHRVPAFFVRSFIRKLGRGL